MVLGARYSRIIRARGTARVLVPSLVARIPDSIASIAIVVLVRSVTGSYATAGLAAAAFSVGTAVSAPVAGRVLDRVGQRRVLPLLAAGFGVTATVLVLTAGQLGRLGLAGLAAAAGLARPPIEAALRAIWSQLVPAGELDAAYALDSSMQELIWIGGPLLLAALLAAGSPRLPLLACAVASMAGTAVYAASPDLPAGRSPAAASAGSPLRSLHVRLLLATAGCYGAAAGILNLGLVAYASAHGGAAWAGVLVAIWGVASLAGGIAYGSRNWRAPVTARALGCLALFGAALLLLAAAPNLTVLALLMIPAGLPLAPWLGSLSAATARHTRPGVSTEAFTWIFAVITAGLAGGNALGGLIIDGAGAAAAFLAAGALCLASAGPGLLWQTRRRRPG